MNTEDRITELEIKFTHQEDIIADLNDVICSQQKTMDTLESRLRILESALKSVSSSSSPDAPEDSRPPHY